MTLMFAAPMVVDMIGEGSITLTAESIKTTLFGANAFSKSYWITSGINATIEGTNQMILNHGDFTKLDVGDIAAQGMLGLNTPQSAAFTSLVDFKPFAGNSSSIVSVNVNAGAGVDFVTGVGAGMVAGLPALQGSMIKPMIQWGSDLSLKVISEGTKKAIE